jgi:hypothetical protein
MECRNQKGHNTMILQAYRTIGGLGGFSTLAPLSTRAPWVDTDTTYCLRVARLCEADCVKYRIDFASGSATLTVTETTGDTTGSALPVAIGDTIKIYAGDFWVEVERVATGYDGYLIVRPIPAQNNEIGHKDTTDPSTFYTYQCFFLYAPADLTVDTVTGSGVDISVYAVGETTVAIADDEEAPGGVAFAASWSDGQAMLAGEYMAIWTRRTAEEDAGEHVNTVTIEYTVGATSYTSVYTGVYVTSLAARTPYYLYGQIAALGYEDQVYTVDDIDSPVPLAISSLPYLLDIGAYQDVMHDAGYDDITFSMALRAAKDSGAESLNNKFDYVLQLNYTTGDGTKPNAPTITSVTFLDGGQAKAVVTHSQENAATRATRIYATLGSETLRENLPYDQDETTTTFIFQTPTTWGASVTVSAYTQDSESRQSASDTDTSDALWGYAGQSYGNIFPASRSFAAPSYNDIASDTWDDVDAFTAAGVSTISLDSTVVFLSRIFPQENIILSGLALQGADISGAGSSDPVEPVSATEFYLCAGGLRVAKIDTVAGKLYCNSFKAGEPPYGCPVADVYGEYSGVVYWQIFDIAAGEWRPYMCVDSVRNCLVFCMPVKTV